MAQIIHNISFPNDGNGDELRTAFGNQNLNNTDLYTNKVDKEVGKGLSTNDYTNAEKTKLAGIEEGAQVNVQADWSQEDDTADDYIKNKPEQLASSVGHFHVSHGGAFSFPQNIVANTATQLVNDGEGDFSTNDFAPNGITNVWDSTTNTFDFSEFSLGDQLAVRADLRVETTSSNQKLQVYLLLGEGTSSEYKLFLDREQIKNIETNLIVQEIAFFSIDNEDWRDTPAKIYFLTDDDAVVTVVGWYVPILRKSVNIVTVEGGGDGVQSVSGSMVDNTDPLNPIINSDITKLDKSPTPLSVYATDEDGNQEMKLISEIGGGGSYTVIAKNVVDSAPVTGTTGDVIVETFVIPANTFQVGDLLELRVRLKKTGTAGGMLHRHGITATEFFTSTSTATNRHSEIRHTAVIKSTTNTEVLENTGGANPFTYEGQFPNSLSVNIDWTIDRTLSIRIRNLNTADSTVVSYWQLARIR